MSWAFEGVAAKEMIFLSAVDVLLGGWDLGSVWDVEPRKARKARKGIGVLRFGGGDLTADGTADERR
jgi:hypothetical protein